MPTGVWAGWTAPVAFSSVSEIGADGAPAGIVCGGLPKVSTGCVQVRNDFQTSVKAAPGQSPAQETLQASIPGSAGRVCWPESRIEAASRSRIAALCETKSAFDESRVPRRPGEPPVVLRLPGRGAE